MTLKTAAKVRLLAAVFYLYTTHMAKGTVRFAPDKPLPLSIVKAVLAARAEEIKKNWGRKKA